jgi:hypothetical protein
MFNTPTAYLNNPVLRWLYAHGWEEPVGPLGPLTAEFGPGPHPWRAGDPRPEPWHVAVGQLVQAVQVKELAARMKGKQGDEMAKSAAAAIESVLDDWCGFPPRKWPWPWPGPPPWVWEIASQLSLVANTLQAGSLRDGLLEVAGQVIQKANAAR